MTDVSGSDQNFIMQRQRHPGRRVTDMGGDGGLTFPVAMGRGAVWMLGTMLSVTGILLGWLCVGQMEQGKILVRMEERSQAQVEQTKAFREEQLKQDLVSSRLSLELKHLQIMAAQHGWKEGPQS